MGKICRMDELCVNLVAQTSHVIHRCDLHCSVKWTLNLAWLLTTNSRETMAASWDDSGWMNQAICAVKWCASLATSMSADTIQGGCHCVWLCLWHWPSLLSTGLISGYRRHWSVISPLCWTLWYAGFSEQNSLSPTEFPRCSSTHPELASGTAALCLH